LTEILQESGSLINAYRPEFDNHQMISVGVNIPILDWGRNKGVYKIATSQQQIAEIAAQQRIQQFEQNAITSAVSFNIRKSRVESAALSDTLASESYESDHGKVSRGTGRCVAPYFFSKSKG
jgi:outer membrane protein TolC